MRADPLWSGGGGVGWWNSRRWKMATLERNLSLFELRPVTDKMFSKARHR
jgi:hypothetical protein